MPVIEQVVILVMDSAGVGALPDAHLYGDEGSNTLGNLSRAVGGLSLPTLGSLGLGSIIPIAGVPPSATPLACYGKMAEQSPGKDTTTGHWEIAGIKLERPFPTYPHGFPPAVIQALTERIGTPVLGNKPASGTEIIAELGAEHMRTGYPIVYTSADSVLQIAAHEEVIPLPRLYEICQIAREIMTGEHAVGRVIARPFIGQPGSFQRTPNRHDYSLKPPRPHLLHLLQEAGLAVQAVGKINDIFAGDGITASFPTKSNAEGMEKTLACVQQHRPGLVFTNLVEFDMLYGHRNDPQGYARALQELDDFLPRLLGALTEKDLLIITADHGCDPTTTSTDHSREYVPLLVYGPALRQGIDLGTRQTFADIAATVGEIFQIALPNGISFAAPIGAV
ncbi:phosphopentomutase [Desulfurispora thermophila]|uniref:phosphopentomutase n=1 Tax=Desulfurispora thermophila TaxID=265470 RepID=UPI00035F81A9|nr:phosphopentomutase [Desulfurispora thermophila]